MLTREDRQKLVEKYPYLCPRNVWTGDHIKDYDYSWIVGESDLPSGWFRLFLLFCKNIKEPLENRKWVDRFMFTQVKDKYGTMRLYNNGAPEIVHYISMCYEQYSKNVCERCGKMAKFETLGWISSVCETCNELFHSVPLEQRKFATYTTYEGKEGYEYSVNFSLKKIDTEYKYVMNLTEQEFIRYLLD